MSKVKIAVEQLAVGNYIYLPVGWDQHPFMFNKLKIKSSEQIALIKSLGITHVICFLDKSDKPPLSMKEVAANKEKHVEEQDVNLLQDEMWKQKQENIQKQKQKSEAINQCQKAFSRAVNTVKSVVSGISHRPINAIQEGAELIDGMASDMVEQGSIVMHLMKTDEDDAFGYYHSLNVSVLSMLVAKHEGMSVEEIRQVGVGALLHDIGKTKIPRSILMKKGGLTNAEQKIFEMHSQFGVEFVSKVDGFSELAKTVIAQHHEELSGGGYPQGLKGEKINNLARLVGLVNYYDNLCHNPDPGKSLIPSEALAYLYKSKQKEFGSEYIQVLIRLLGVYPPGTIVKLSNDMIGLVISVNSEHLLYPSIIIYDPNIPRSDAVIFDMGDTKDISIVSSIKPSELAPEIHEYLTPMSRVSYFCEM